MKPIEENEKFALLEVSLGNCAGIELHRYECIRKSNELTMFVAFEKDVAKHLFNAITDYAG